MDPQGRRLALLHLGCNVMTAVPRHPVGIYPGNDPVMSPEETLLQIPPIHAVPPAVRRLSLPPAPGEITNNEKVAATIRCRREAAAWAPGGPLSLEDPTASSLIDAMHAAQASEGKVLERAPLNAQGRGYRKVNLPQRGVAVCKKVELPKTIRNFKPLSTRFTQCPEHTSLPKSLYYSTNQPSPRLPVKFSTQHTEEWVPIVCPSPRLAPDAFVWSYNAPSSSANDEWAAHDKAVKERDTETQKKIETRKAKERRKAEARKAREKTRIEEHKAKDKARIAKTAECINRGMCRPQGQGNQDRRILPLIQSAEDVMPHGNQRPQQRGREGNERRRASRPNISSLSPHNDETPPPVPPYPDDISTFLLYHQNLEYA